jgi:hypothetical protein
LFLCRCHELRRRFARLLTLIGRRLARWHVKYSFL